MLTLSGLFTVILKLIRRGISTSVPDLNVNGITTSSPNTNTTLLLKIKRLRTSKDAIFGEIVVDGKWVCYSMERTAVAIPLGSYNATMELSPHFGFATPHLDVPNRTYIEVHPANYPSQLQGCIAVGQQIDGDALDNSRAAFDSLAKLLPPEAPFLVSVVSSIV